MRERLQNTRPISRHGFGKVLNGRSRTAERLWKFFENQKPNREEERQPVIVCVLMLTVDRKCENVTLPFVMVSIIIIFMQICSASLKVVIRGGCQSLLKFKRTITLKISQFLAAFCSKCCGFLI